MSEIGGMSYEDAQTYRRAVFNLVCDKQNWKNRIDATLPNALVSIPLLLAIQDAVVHFTGSTASYEELPSGDYRITALGYYAICGA